MSTLANVIIYSDAAQLALSINSQMDLDDHDEYGYTPLIQTAIVNDVAKTQVILEAGANPNFADLTGRTALHWAVDNANEDMIKLLLKSGANPNAYTIGSQPVLVQPLLRKQSLLRDQLLEAGADLTFAYDYVNTKLLGHRFKLTGYVDIADPTARFTEVALEGFILEFSLDVIRASLRSYRHNYAARRVMNEFARIADIEHALDNAIYIAKCQHYLMKLEEHRQQLQKILQQPLCIIPIGQEGHAITVIKCHNFLAICDRANHEDPDKATVAIYTINTPENLSVDLLQAIVFKRQALADVEQLLVQQLGLKPLDQLALPRQISGNCSWANVEACLPTVVLLSTMTETQDKARLDSAKKEALSLHRHWRTWDQERALQFCMQDFAQASVVRQASKLALLAAVFVHACSANRALDLVRAEKIYPLLATEGYEYILESYVQAYCQRGSSVIGDNLKKLLSIFGDIDLS